MNRFISVVLFCWLCLAGALPAVAGMALTEATGRRVTEVEVENHSLVRTKEILKLFGLGEGDHYTAGVVQEGLKRLSQKPEIANVLVHGRPEGAGGVALRLEVQGTLLVSSIRFRGNRTLKDDALRPQLRTEVDRPLRETMLELDRAALAKRYAEAGYPEAHIGAHRKVGPDGHWVRVEFHIEEGAPRRIDRITWPDDLPMETWRAEALLGLRPGAPASESQLRQGARRLVEVLHREGHPEARCPRPRFTLQGSETVLVLPLVCGPAIDLRIRGVEEWHARTLRPIYNERFGEVIDRAWLDEVSGAMAEKLREGGFYSAQVHAEDGFGYGRRRVTFHVESGPKATVERVEFHGNHTFSSRELHSYMSLVVGGVVSAPLFSTISLERDLKTLADFYGSHGFLDARVTLLDQDVSPAGRVYLTIHVDEGERYRYRDLRFSGDPARTQAELLNITGLKEGKPANPTALEKARRGLLRDLATRGRGAAKVQYRTVKDAEHKSVAVAFEVAGGPPETFGKIVVSGNVRTQTKVILRELTFREGELWNPEAVAESRRRIYRLGFFRSVRIEPLDAEVGGGARDVRIFVKEQDAGSLTFGLGYGSEEGPKGYVSLGHTNLQGYGRALEFRASADQLDESYAVNFREPWLFNRPIDLRLSLLRTSEERESYTLASTGFQSALEKEFLERLRGSLLYTLSQNRLSDVKDEDALNDDHITDYLLSAIGPVLVWDSRDDPFHPRRGFYHTATAEWALDALGSEVRYDRYTASASTFLSARKHTLALYAGAGVALKLDHTTDLPVNKRFFLGGRNTVRGYERDEIGPTGDDGTAVGGDTMLNVKVEWRYPLWRKLRGVLFWDAGNIWNRLEHIPDYVHLRHGVGGGLRYLTPVGPLSLDVGWKLDRRGGEAPYAWHFTVGNVF